MPWVGNGFLAQGVLLLLDYLRDLTSNTQRSYFSIAEIFEPSLSVATSVMVA